MLRQIVRLLHKEFLLEIKLKNGFFGLLLYVIGTVFICYLSFYLKTQKLVSITWNAVLWIILFFGAVNAVAKSFMGERRERNLYYHYLASPEAILISKIIYNFFLLLLLILLASGLLYSIFPLTIRDGWHFIGVLVAGSFSFSASLTLISSIASKSGSNATLMTILSIPVIIPLLLLLIKMSNHAIDGLDPNLISNEWFTLGGINVIVGCVSYILFPYLWKS